MGSGSSQFRVYSIFPSSNCSGSWGHIASHASMWSHSSWLAAQLPHDRSCDGALSDGALCGRRAHGNIFASSKSIAFRRRPVGVGAEEAKYGRDFSFSSHLEAWYLNGVDRAALRRVT